MIDQVQDQDGKYLSRAASRAVLYAAAKEIVDRYSQKRPPSRHRLKAARKRLRQQEARDRERKRNPQFQGVYVIGTASGPVKIGIAVDPERRLKELQTGYPQKLTIFDFVGELPAGAARRVEQECHRRAHAQRMTGEWFDMDWEDASALMRDTLQKFDLA